MRTRTYKSQENKSKSYANSFSKKQNDNATSLQFNDNRQEATMQRKLKELATTTNSSEASQTIQKRENKTGLPDKLKTGVENLSGYSMDDVKVHYNSDKPEQLHSHAYAQGTHIHIASGQEKHLAHEAWHVVQQKQGRVKPTLQMKGKVNINNDAQLEREADVLGSQALNQGNTDNWIAKTNSISPNSGIEILSDTVQRKQYHSEIIQLMQVADLEGQAAPDVEGCCAKVGNAFRHVGHALWWAAKYFFKNLLPNPKVVYDNWDSVEGNIDNDDRATNLTWEADKIAWIKKILLTIATLIPTKGIYDTISALFTGRLEIQYTPTVRFIPSVEFAAESASSAANGVVVAGLLTAAGSLHLLEMKIRNRVAFITPTPSQRNATRRVDAHLHND